MLRRAEGAKRISTTHVAAEAMVMKRIQPITDLESGSSRKKTKSVGQKTTRPAPTPSRITLDARAVASAAYF